MKGSKQGAILYGAKLNVLRGKVDIGELAKFILNIKTSFGWTIEKIVLELRLSKGYTSKLLSIAKTPTILEKLKNGFVSFKEAYSEVLSFPGELESQGTGYKREPFNLNAYGKGRETQLLTDEDLGLTTNLKQAMGEASVSNR